MIIQAELRDGPSENPIFRALYAEMARRGAQMSYFDFFWPPMPNRIVQIQFPESHANRSSLAKSLLKSGLFAISTALSRLRGCAIIWTVNNAASHEGRYPGLERWLMNFFASRVSGLVTMSRAPLTQIKKRFPVLESVPVASIPHPNYKSLIDAKGDRFEARKAFGFLRDEFVLMSFGQIRPYKNIHGLIAQFKLVAEPELRLIVAGRVIDSGYEGQLLTQALGDPRICTVLESLSEAQLPMFYAAADLFVAPFSTIANSGSVILTLSYGVPVLTPRLGAMPELQQIVGDQWLRLYDGRLTPEILRDAISWAKQGRSGEPEMSAMDLGVVAQKTLDFYASVLGKGASN